MELHGNISRNSYGNAVVGRYGICNGQGHVMWNCQGGDKDEESSEEAEHGFFPFSISLFDGLHGSFHF